MVSDPCAVEVTIDGQTVPHDATEGFQYDEQTQTVELFGSWIPDPGQEVVVSCPEPASCP